MGKQRPDLTLVLPSVRTVLNPEPAPELTRFSLQLLKGVTIASGGVLPRIHPELLAKKRGTKGKSETILSPPPEKRGRKAASGKKGGKKSKAAKPRTSKKVSLGCLCEPGMLREQEKVEAPRVPIIVGGLGTPPTGRKWQRASETRA